MSLQAHLTELEKRHEALDEKIKQETAHSSSDDIGVTELKRKRLKLKEQIEQIRQDLQKED